MVTIHKASSASSITRTHLIGLMQPKRIILFTGAGTSAEAGIPTFRTNEGSFWSNNHPEEVANIITFRRNACDNRKKAGCSTTNFGDWSRLRNRLIFTARSGNGSLTPRKTTSSSSYALRMSTICLKRPVYRMFFTSTGTFDICNVWGSTTAGSSVTTIKRKTFAKIAYSYDWRKPPREMSTLKYPSGQRKILKP